MHPKNKRAPSAILNSSILYLDPDSGLTLQDQIRRKIIEGIVVGALPPGQRLPSTRSLAHHLGVSRNTVTLAYQQLIADGHLSARERAGIFVSEATPRGPKQPGRVGGRGDDQTPLIWRRRIRRDFSDSETFFAPSDWHRYPFPFVEGRFDRSLFPVREWRDASRHALAVSEIDEWSIDAGDADDPFLIQEIQTKVLPRRGIHARSDQILVTTGAQQTLQLTAELLAEPGIAVAMEEPGQPELRLLLESCGARIVPQPVDEEGMVVDSALESCAIVFVSPGHQRPTAATMSLDRRREFLAAARKYDFIIVEDDFECETDYLDPSFPALASSEGRDRVVYAATLAQTLAPGLRLGIMVGAPNLIRAARSLRRLSSRHQPYSLQRTAAHLLALGHYDAIMMRVGRIFQERLLALRDALNHYLPQSIAISPVRGGTTFWVRGPEKLDADDLARAAEARGVLIEPVGRYFARRDGPKNMFRLGITSIPTEKIREGVAVLAAVIREASGEIIETIGEGLSGDELRAVLPGAVLLGKTIYGDPCTIELNPDGTMDGRAGFANEDVDNGRWWVEDDLWCRQWSEWAYGEVAKFRTVIDGDRIRWFNAEGRLVDAMVISRS